jgi:hypothetical protein
VTIGILFCRPVAISFFSILFSSLATATGLILVSCNCRVGLRWEQRCGEGRSLSQDPNRDWRRTKIVGKEMGIEDGAIATNFHHTQIRDSD